MASETGSTPYPLTGAGTGDAASLVIARQDRIPIWSLSYLFIGIIGVGFLFTFYDIFVINVSFIQTCTQIVSGCNAGNAATYFGLPVELNLAGYVIGALILSPLADRFGRRNTLLFTLILTGIGSLYTLFVSDYTSFIIARTITGLGIGADLALVNTYINEVAPRASRARYTSLIFIMSSLGAFFGIWLGLWLTTPPANLPPPEAAAAVAGEAGMIAAFGTFGFIATAIFAYFFGESLERKLWLPIAAVLTIIGTIMIAAFASSNFALAAIGSIITFFGFNLWVPMTYAWTTESFPTRARATGFALADGIGHLGGGVGILVIAPLIPTLLMNLGSTTGPIVIFLMIAAFLIVAAIVAQFGTATRQKRLDEVDPKSTRL